MKRMKRKQLLPLCVGALLALVACQPGRRGTEIHQSSRDRVVSVREAIREIPTDEVLLGNVGVPNVLGECLVVVGECATNECCVHLFSRDDYRYLKSAIPIGPGPEEITIWGPIATDESHGRFFLPDFGKRKIFVYELDSLLRDEPYAGAEWLSLDADAFPSDYTYVNDTLCVGRVIYPRGNSDFVPRVARWNMTTGAIVPISPVRDDLEKIRVTCAASGEYGLYVEMYNRVDLLSIGDFEGRVKANIYGPEWNSRQEKSYYSKAVFTTDGKLIVSYSGEDYATARTTKLLVFDLDGNYLRTLDVGYDILSMCYDGERDRLIMNFDDDSQLGYLDLEGLI